MAFPQEIVDHIVSFARKEDCLSLLTVSRRFQAAVERLFWAELRFWIEEDIEVFSRTCRGVRCRYLRQVKIWINFRPDDLDYLGESFFSHSKRRNKMPYVFRSHNVTFTTMISKVFSALKAMETLEPAHYRPAGIWLDMHVYSSTPCDTEALFGWYLHLIKPNSLPVLTCIRKLTLGPFDCQHARALRTPWVIGVGIIPGLVAKFPNIEEILYLSDSRGARVTDYKFSFTKPPSNTRFGRFRADSWEYERANIPQRKAMGHTFASALLGASIILPAKMDSVRLNCETPFYLCDWKDDRGVRERFNRLPYDAFSSALRLFSQRVTKLRLDYVTVDSALFWPTPEENMRGPPQWPHLTVLEIILDPLSPTGEKYYDGYRDGPSSPVKLFPNDEAIEPLLLTFTRALENMPMLETCFLIATLEDRFIRPEYPDWGVRLFIPKNGMPPQCEWYVGQWRPGEIVHQHFRDFGVNRSGRPLKEIWLDQNFPWDEYCIVHVGPCSCCKLGGR